MVRFVLHMLKLGAFYCESYETIRTISISYRVACYSFSTSGVANVESCDIFSVGDGLENMYGAYIVY